MPDIVVEGSVVPNNELTCYSRYVVGIDEDTHYCFFVGAGSDLRFQKSTDGGATWALLTVPIVNSFTIKFNVWYDRWTPGDTGTLIHIVLLDSDPAPDHLSYFNLDTIDDSISAELVLATPTLTSSDYNGNQCTIAKARGGNLLVQYWRDAIGDHGCFRSVDGGASFVARADGADGNPVDYVMMFPGGDVDDQDMWMLYLDVSTNELSLKTYDDSANSWSEALIVVGITEALTFWQYAGAIRQSDNHLLATVWTIQDDPTADLLTFDINGAASIVAMGNVVTNLAESGNACLTINQQNDDVFVGYNKGGVFGATVDSVYRLSTDGMATWGAEQVMSEDIPDDLRSLSSTISIGDAGGKFLPCWFSDDLFDMLCNVNNAVSIAPAPPPPPEVAEVAAAPVEPGLLVPQYGQIIINTLVNREYGQLVSKDTSDSRPAYSQVITRQT